MNDSSRAFLLLAPSGWFQPRGFLRSEALPVDASANHADKGGSIPHQRIFLTNGNFPTRYLRLLISGPAIGCSDGPALHGYSDVRGLLYKRPLAVIASRRAS
jgi:hypothetical protein